MDEHGQVRQCAGVQRDECAGYDQRLGIVASDDGDDAGSVGEPVSRDQRVARCDLQGERQLLPGGNVDSRQRPAGGGTFGGAGQKFTARRLCR